MVAEPRKLKVCRGTHWRNLFIALDMPAHEAQIFLRRKISIRLITSPVLS
jgi:hypothetical protein